VKLNTVTPVIGMINTTKNSAVTTATPGAEPGPGLPEKKSGFTVGGWSGVNSSSSGGGFKKPGWITVPSPPKPGSPPSPPPPEPPHATTAPPPPMASTCSFRSGSWTTLEGPLSASTPNKPLTPNVDHPIPPHHPAAPPEPAPIPNLPEPSTSGFKPVPSLRSPQGSNRNLRFSQRRTVPRAKELRPHVRADRTSITVDRSGELDAHNPSRRAKATFRSNEQMK